MLKNPAKSLRKHDNSVMSAMQMLHGSIASDTIVQAQHVRHVTPNSATERIVRTKEARASWHMRTRPAWPERAFSTGFWR
jgi:hypothetical protein